MNFVSYAQNFEDVMLWRALAHIKNGCYIDVGANDPIADSVTKAFYDAGWSGINIEPLEKHWLDLQKTRNKDINLQCAAGSEAGEIDLWECDIRGWATASQDVVNLHTQHGHYGQYRKVSIRTLSDICAEYVKSDIHFLKIDVEGFEKDVLLGMDFARFRPWIVIVEATKPNSKDEVYEDWEYLVLNNKYSLAYCDGLNRFYVADEHSELLVVLRYPPNVFDNFIRAKQLYSESRAQQAESRIQIELNRADEAEVKAQQAESRIQIELNRANEAEIKVQQAEAKTSQAEAKAQQINKVENQVSYLIQLAEDKVYGLELEIDKLQQDIIDLKLNQKELLSQIVSWQTRVSDLYQSTSWRITWPLRYIKKVISGEIFKENNRFNFRFFCKKQLKRLFKYAVNFILKRPKLKGHIIKILSKYPKLNRYLMQAKSNLISIPNTNGRDIKNDEIVFLTPFELEINEKLKKFMNN